jgi:hypothetical protein
VRISTSATAFSWRSPRLYAASSDRKSFPFWPSSACMRKYTGYFWLYNSQYLQATGL